MDTTSEPLSQVLSLDRCRSMIRSHLKVTPNLVEFPDPTDDDLRVHKYYQSQDSNTVQIEKGGVSFAWEKPTDDYAAIYFYVCYGCWRVVSSTTKNPKKVVVKQLSKKHLDTCPHNKFTSMESVLESKFDSYYTCLLTVQSFQFLPKVEWLGGFRLLTRLFVTFSSLGGICPFQPLTNQSCASCSPPPERPKGLN